MFKMEFWHLTAASRLRGLEEEREVGLLRWEAREHLLLPTIPSGPPTQVSALSSQPHWWGAEPGLGS